LPRHVLPVPRHEIGDRTGNRRQYRGTAWAIESKAEWEKVGLIVCGANIDAGRYSECWLADKHWRMQQQTQTEAADHSRRPEGRKAKNTGLLCVFG
jgi:hypothetical protein